MEQAIIRSLIRTINLQLKQGLEEYEPPEGWIDSLKSNLRSLLLKYKGPGRDELIQFGSFLSSFNQLSEDEKKLMIARALRYLALVSLNLEEKETHVSNEVKGDVGKKKENKKIYNKKKRWDELQLEDPIYCISGIGPRSQNSFYTRRIFKVKDILYFLPKQYEDRREPTLINRLKIGEIAFTRGQILDWQIRNVNKKILKVTISDNPLRPHFNTLKLIFFHFYGSPQAKFPIGKWVNVFGQVDSYKGGLCMIHPEVEISEEEPSPEIVPVYPEVEGISQKKFLTFMRTITSNLIEKIKDPLPQYIREKRGLSELKETLKMLHNPPINIDKELLEKLNSKLTPYHRRLAYEELFYIQVGLAMKKGEEEKLQAPTMEDGEKVIERCKKLLPFQLTKAQERVIHEINQDMAQSHPMRRLLQGDVGSGKTIVAFIASAIALFNGFQVAIMAPTELLAEQHIKNLYPLFKEIGFRAALLIGDARQSTKRAIKEQLALGHMHVVIGTHALIQEGIEFKRLGLVIIDEQHRFGVGQRLRLVQKGKNKETYYPHLLVMTATPIPRSLALTVYGDLDLSIIDEMPPGRIPPVTEVYRDKERDKVYQFVYQRLKEGDRAYVVCPLIEESEHFELASAKKVYDELKEKLAPFKVELLHGKLPGQEKDQIMERFIRGETQVLVSTTVIEVGIDVPEAKIMVIEGSERFGLAQLHQLRGRIGRGGGGESYCFLIVGNYSKESWERVRIIKEHRDGFKIAEYDLELRGPGELYGSRQSGLPGFRFARLSRDYELLLQAREDAFELIARDPELKMYPELKSKIEEIWGWSGEKIVAEEAG